MISRVIGLHTEHTGKLAGLMGKYLCAGLAIWLSISVAQAGEADVVSGNITALGDGRFRVDATVLHDDAGWDHYANRWDVLSVDGELLGSRVLAHPHDHEQPFTRSLTLQLPEGTHAVILRAHDSVHELGGKEFHLELP